MVRIILFLVLIALAAAGAAWVAEQPGDVVLSWGGMRIVTTLPVFVLGARHRRRRGDICCGRSCAELWRTPERMRRGRRERRQARGRHADHARIARDRPWRFRRPRARMPKSRASMRRTIRWRCLLHAQSAQLDGDREGAQRAFRAMAEREDTRLLGLRGLFIEAQRADDPVAAVMVAEEALKLVAVVVMGVACRARLLLRQGRLGRRADHPRQQSIRRADRQGDLSPSARRAADGARAGAAKRSIATCRARA